MMKIYFSDFFDVDPVLLDAHGAFNVSLINDLPVFIDPFLLFNSEKPEYRALHDEIIRYIRFLRDVSNSGRVNVGLLNSWYRFPEVKQNWLGYSKVGNKGSGLGPAGDDFAARVRVLFAAEVDLKSQKYISALVTHWTEEVEAMLSIVPTQEKLDDRFQLELNAHKRFVGKTWSILIFIRDRVQCRDFDALFDHGVRDA